VKQCVEQLGSSTPATKTGAGTLFGYLQSVSTGMFSDEPVKNVLTARPPRGHGCLGQVRRDIKELQGSDKEFLKNV